MDIVEILKSKIEKDELPSFLIFEGFEENETDDIIGSLLSRPKIGHILNSPDILSIRPLDGKYGVEDGSLNDVFKFSLHRPLELKNKWIFWSQADLITDTMSNKLLKLLEEPPAFLKIVFFIPMHSTLLKTIQSRAIRIKFNKQLNSQKTFTPSEFQALTKSEQFLRSRDFNENEERILFAKLVDQKQNFKAAEKLLQTAKKLEKNRPFHQNQGHRLYQYLML